jgi:hypothetical protein
MADEKHLEILKQGVEIWNQWRVDHPEIKPLLSGAYLSGADLARAQLSRAILTRTDLRGAHLSGADLSKAILIGAQLSMAQLSEADLSGAQLSEADLSGADLSRAHLSGTYLEGAHLSKADLSGAELSKATFGYTAIANVDLSQVEGLDTIVHRGPSSIGIDTIYQSQGQIPEIFLRGAGVPVNFIEYIPHLIEDAIQFYSCFISYSTKDQDFAERLHADLQSKGVRCWFAPEDIKGGRKIYEQIPEAIRVYDKLLLVISDSSMKSEWVKTEIYHARQDEIRTGKRKLFPIGLNSFEEIQRWKAFDADVGKDMAREIREYYIPDFSGWKDHDPYKKAFDRLLRDLRAEN